VKKEPAMPTRMVKLVKDHVTPPEETWVCEGCGGVHVGVNPPDECFCGHHYFDNVADQLSEKARGTVH
jgi:rubrerythrin